MGYNDDGGSGVNFKISRKISPRDGKTYYLKVRGYGDRTSGNYNLFFGCNCYNEVKDLDVLFKHNEYTLGAIHWKNRTNYPDSFIEKAAVPWNKISGGHQIKKDKWNTRADVIFEEIYEKTDWIGIYKPKVTNGKIAGRIIMNRYYLESNPDEYIINVMAHEFGHATGLNDFDKIAESTGIYENSSNIMTYTRNRNQLPTIGECDKEVFRYVFGIN